MEALVVLLQLGFPFALLLLGYVIGKSAENRHYKSIREREHRFLRKPAITSRQWDQDHSIANARLVSGSVVVSVDYFKRFLASFRNIFGGEVKSYSSLIDRGRREALLRMKEMHPGADIYVNCRMETSTISNGRQQAMGTIEVLAYATALTYHKGAAYGESATPNGGSV